MFGKTGFGHKGYVGWARWRRRGRRRKARRNVVAVVEKESREAAGVYCALGVCPP